jgi:hypothetical protein
MVQWISPLLANTTCIRIDAASQPQLWCSYQTGSVHDNDTCTMQTSIKVRQILQNTTIYHIFVKVPIMEDLRLTCLFYDAKQVHCKSASKYFH